MIAVAIILSALLLLLLLQKSGALQPASYWAKCPHCGCYWTIEQQKVLVLVPGHVPDSATGTESETTCPHCLKEEQEHAI